jgi:hypothetical protein
MYAVIFKDRVIVGPMNWNRGIFQGSLEKEKIKILLPRVAPDTLPLVINSDVKIMQVEENRPQINSMVEYYYGPIWDISGDTAIASYVVMDQNIDTARNNFKQLAAEERWKKEVAGTTVEVQGTTVTIETDRETRNIFIQKLSIMSDTETVNWKFPESWLVLSKLDLVQVVTAGAQYIQSCFDWEKDISDQIDSAQTKEELLSIPIKSAGLDQPLT